MGVLPVLVNKRCLIDGHHAVGPGGRLVRWSLLLGEMVTSHANVHVSLSLIQKKRKQV